MRAPSCHLQIQRFCTDFLLTAAGSFNAFNTTTVKKSRQKASKIDQSFPFKSRQVVVIKKGFYNQFFAQAPQLHSFQRTSAQLAKLTAASSHSPPHNQFNNSLQHHSSLLCFSFTADASLSISAPPYHLQPLATPAFAANCTPRCPLPAASLRCRHNTRRSISLPRIFLPKSPSRRSHIAAPSPFSSLLAQTMPFHPSPTAMTRQHNKARLTTTSLSVSTPPVFITT
jgi:hypothetical protein